MRGPEAAVSGTYGLRMKAPLPLRAWCAGAWDEIAVLGGCLMAVARLAQPLQILPVQPSATCGDRHDVIRLRAQLRPADPAHRLFAEHHQPHASPIRVIASLRTRPA